MKIAKVCFDNGGLGKTKGCSKAPSIIIEKLTSKDFEIIDIDVDNNNISLTNEEIEKTINKNKPDVIIGGDHSITYSSFIGSDCKGLIVFDAHPDVVNNFNPPTHEDYLKTLIEEGRVDAKNVIIVGARNISNIEKKYIDKKKILCLDMDKIDEMGKEEICDLIMEHIRRIGNMYLSIDIDVLDPAFAPGTGYPEPGGMSTHDFLYFLKRINILDEIKAVDVVEINPDKDVNGMTVAIGARIVSELIKAQ